MLQCDPQVDPGVTGKYSCSIEWENGVAIQSKEATLVVRSIKKPPTAFSMAYGASANLTCIAIGDKAALIEFFIENGEAPLNGVKTIESHDDQGRVITDGRLSPKITTSAKVYCVVKWDDDSTKSLSSDLVSIKVLTVNLKSPGDALDGHGWVAQNSTLPIECVYDILQYSHDQEVYPRANIEWKLRLGPSSKWFKVDGNDVIKYVKLFKLYFLYSQTTAHIFLNCEKLNQGITGRTGPNIAQSNLDRGYLGVEFWGIFGVISSRFSNHEEAI